jgi:hypothetical protein
MPMPAAGILACLTSRIKSDKKHLEKVLDQDPQLRKAMIALLGR